MLVKLTEALELELTSSANEGCGGMCQTGLDVRFGLGSHLSVNVRLCL
jgi:hypothetical protein